MQGCEGRKQDRPLQAVRFRFSHAKILCGDAKMQAVFKEVKDSARWIMLSEPEVPDVVLTCKDALMRGKYIELVCESDEGQEIHAAVFDRDVAACVKEWGQNPIDWGTFHPIKKAGQSRYKLVPCDPQPEPEETKC